MSKKIFEKKLDERIIGLDKYEKEKLKYQFEDAQNKLRRKPNLHHLNSGSLPTSKNYKKVPVKRMVWNFFLSVFLKIPFKKDANISIARIRLIKKSLINLGIPFYNFKNNTLNPELALYILDIYKTAKAVFEVFFNPKSDPVKDQFFEKATALLLSPETRDALDNITRPGIELIFEDHNITNKREYLKDRQQYFIEYLKQHDIENLQFSLLPLEQLTQFYMDFDFKNFFELFGTFIDPVIQFHSRKVIPNTALDAIKNLSGLFKLFTEDKLKPDLEKALRLINLEINPFNNPTIQANTFVDAINKALLLSRKVNQFMIMDHLIQYISMDETETCVQFTPKRTLFARFINLIIAESSRTFNQMEDEKIREMLWKDIFAFFGISTEAELHYPGIYQDKTKCYLETFQIRGMGYVKPIGILLSFLNKHYENQIRPLINRIVVKGTFFKHSEGEIFSALYYKFDQLIVTLNDFLNTELSPSEISKKPIIDLIVSGKELTHTDIKHIQDKVASWDREICSSITFIIDDLQKILNYFFRFRDDFKNPYPELLTNIRILKTEQGNTLYPSFETAIKTIEHFFFIMRNFIIIKGELNTKLRGLQED